jgi:hypothetical protein
MKYSHSMNIEHVDEEGIVFTFKKVTKWDQRVITIYSGSFSRDIVRGCDVITFLAGLRTHPSST